MNKYFIFGLILSNMIFSCLSKTFNSKMNKIVFNNEVIEKNKEKTFYNETKANFELNEDNENNTG